jgi:hypothetical protein
VCSVNGKTVYLFMSCGSLMNTTWACPQVAGGGDGLQIRRVVASMLNKQSRTAEKSEPTAQKSDLNPHR